MLQNAMIIVGSLWIPVALLIGAMVLLKWVRKREGRRSPLVDKLFHQPGEQLRKRIESLDDDIQERIGRLIAIGPMMLLALLLPRVNWSGIRIGWGEFFVLAFSFAFIAWNIRGIWRLWNRRKDAQFGLLGEIATAQALDRLVAKGCLVFHDVPGDKANIDHVVIAPNAVFAVETKWRSKRGKGAASAEVWYDGTALQFPGGYRDEAPLGQARACAGWLSKLLHGKTGEPVRVVPVVALPGWYVKERPTAKGAEVRVINPKLQWTLLNTQGAPIPQAQRNRIVHAISERYPEIEG